MDPQDIHHGIRHPLSRIQTNNFQDKRGCSINGIRSFLFDQGIVRNLDDIENLINNYMYDNIQDYRGYPIQLRLNYDNYNFPLSDEILKMKNVRFIFQGQSKPIHKLVSPKPYFVKEERNLIENHFSYLRRSYSYRTDVEDWEYFYMDDEDRKWYHWDDIEDCKCFELDNEGHLVTINNHSDADFQLSNEKIEHLSNFPHLRNLDIFFSTIIKESVTNLSLLSNLKNLTICLGQEFDDREMCDDI